MADLLPPVVPDDGAAPDAPASADAALLTALQQALTATGPGWVRTAHYHQLTQALAAAKSALTNPTTHVSADDLAGYQAKVAAAQRAVADPWNAHYPHNAAAAPRLHRLLEACHSAVTAALADLAGDAAGRGIALARVAAWRESEVPHAG